MLDLFALYKQKTIIHIYDNSGFMTKNLKKEITVRSNLCNKFNESRAKVNLQNYRKQRSNCVKILKHVKSNTLTTFYLKSFTVTLKILSDPFFPIKVKVQTRSSSIKIMESSMIARRYHILWTSISQIWLKLWNQKRHFPLWITFGTSP